MINSIIVFVKKIILKPIFFINKLFYQENELDFKYSNVIFLAMSSASDTKSSATIEQVAERCKVSSMTVSRALRSDASVSEQTRQRVLKVAEELGYRPRVGMGRPRREQKEARPIVEVIFGITHSAFYSEILTAIERELAARHHDCTIRTVNGDYEEFVKLCDLLRGSSDTPTMMIGYLPFAQLQTLLQVRPKTLLVDHTGDPRYELDYSSIGFDNTEAACMVVRHLLSLGRRRILLLNGFADHYFSREVERGYREMLAQAGIRIDDELIVETDFTTETAVGKLNAALNAGLDFDAVMTNDEMATGVLHTLHGRGLKVPDDIAVAGCDGLRFTRYLWPPLTTVQLDVNELGSLAVEHVFQVAQKKQSRYRMRILPQLVIRESTSSHVRHVSSNKGN